MKIIKTVTLIIFMSFLYSSVFAQCVNVTEDQTIANKFTRHTVTGITTPLPEGPDIEGFIGASYLTVADIDGDGVNEIVATSGVGNDSDPGTADGSVALFTWDGFDKDSWSKTVLNSTFAFPNETIVRDIDGDDDADIVVLDNFILASFPGGVFFLENAGGDITNASNWSKQTIYEDAAGAEDSYHRAEFIDLDGDGDVDIITTNWLAGRAFWLENNGDGTWSDHDIGTGGVSLFALYDLDQDGDEDMVVPRFAITGSLFICAALGAPDGSDPAGDSLIWFENPGQTALAADSDLPWNRYTIDNWYTSGNPVGKAFEVVVSDIDNDGTDELVMSNHNHQNYDGSGNRIWPSGIYYLEIPGLGGNAGDPTVAADWLPITIETGDPDFAYSPGFTQFAKPYLDPAVWDDPYAVDRRGSFYDQGSPGMVRAGDVNGDGLSDVVVPGDGKGRLYYYEADSPSGGCLSLYRATLYDDLQCMPGEAEIADLDKDGDMDIVAAIFDTSVDHPYPYTSSSIFFYENTDETIVELKSFEASPGCNVVNLVWSTASETNNAGFNVYRSETESGTYEKINASLIPGRGSPTGGADYTLTDDLVANGTTYYYVLEDIDANGTPASYGPEAATPRLIYLLLR